MVLLFYVILGFMVIFGIVAALLVWYRVTVKIVRLIALYLEIEMHEIDEEFSVYLIMILSFASALLGASMYYYRG